MLIPLLSVLFLLLSSRAHRDLHSFPTRRSSDLSIFIPKLRLILILNSFLGSSDSLVFSELFHSLAPRPSCRRSEERFSRNAETDFVCRLLLEKNKPRPQL